MQCFRLTTVVLLLAITLASAASVPQWKYAGACGGWIARERAIPGRRFYAADNVTLQDPMDALAKAGFNAYRVETSLGISNGPTTSYNNSGDVLGRELVYQLDIGGHDVQALLAQQAQARGMKIVLTINFGTDIPSAWISYNYSQMLKAIDIEVRRQLADFVSLKVQPDIILFGNEATDGMLFNVPLPNGTIHARGINDGMVSQDQLTKELTGVLPTGNMASYPQLAGYYKQQVLSCQSVLSSVAGFNVNLTRYGLHSHGQYFQWKTGIVWGASTSETTIVVNGVTYNFNGIIPNNILQLKASQLMDIMGHSAYPDPMQPSDINDVKTYNATFTQTINNIVLAQSLIPSYGYYPASSPFAGQYHKQVLGVEYCSTFPYTPQGMAAQKIHTDMFFKLIQSYPFYLGVLWWEPTYAFNDWEGGDATLYTHKWWTSNTSNCAPTPTLAQWGSYAVSHH